MDNDFLSPLSEEEDLLLKKKRKTRIIIFIIALFIILLATGIILFIVLKPSSKDNTQPDDVPKPVDELPFEVQKGETETQLIPKSGKYDYIFMFIHGLLGKPEEYIPTFNKKDGPIPDNFKIILPCAPVQYNTIVNMTTTSWFDIKGKQGDINREEIFEFSDIVKSADRLEKIIENEVKNVNYNYSRVFVGGFSQGAVMTFQIGLSFNYTLGGIVTFCGIPLSQTKIKEGRENLNILSIIGGKDIYIPLNYSKPKYEEVLKNFTNLNIQTFEEEEHAVANSELGVFKDFIKSLISK